MIRAILLAASAVTGSLTVGKRALNAEIDRRKSKLIEESAIEAREQIRARSSSFLAGISRQIARNAGIRLGFLAILWSLRATAILPPDIFSIAAASGLTVFLIADLRRAAPTVRFGLMQLRQHGWKPRSALSEAIAASVFDDVMSKAEDYPIGRTQRLLLSVAGHKPEGLAQDVALAVSDVARTTSWDDMKPYLILAAINITTFWCFYLASMWIVLNAT